MGAGTLRGTLSSGYTVQGMLGGMAGKYSVRLVKGVQSGQDYRVCTNFTDLYAYSLLRFYPLLN